MDAYFCWLVGLIGDSYIQCNYQKLLWKLYQTEFIWELDYDRNRAMDGLALRDLYAESGGVVSGEWLPMPGCSMLEMMAALCKREEDYVMHDSRYGNRVSVWFWEMIQNLHLDIYDDYHWFEDEVSRILDIFLHRRYAPDGTNGGAFPLMRATRDLRQTDLWWQMNAYMQEVHPIV